MILRPIVINAKLDYVLIKIERGLQLCCFFFVISTFFGCLSKKLTSTMPGQLRQEYYSFSKTNGKRSIGEIDTLVIYIQGEDLVVGEKNGKPIVEHVYHYLVFKGNGIAFFSYSSARAFDQNNIYSMDGQYCYYKVDGNELRLELFDSHLRKFTIMYGKIYLDRILFYKDKLRVFWGGQDKRNMLFNKSDITYDHPLNWPK